MPGMYSVYAIDSTECGLEHFVGPHASGSATHTAPWGDTHLVPDVIIRLLNHIGVVVVEIAARQEAVDGFLVRVTAGPHRLAVCHLEAGLGGGVQPVVPA